MDIFQAGTVICEKKPLPQSAHMSKINSYLNELDLLTTPCSILQNYSLLHLEGLDLPRVKKTRINIIWME